MKRTIHYIELGGTLFVPASHKNLEAIIARKKYPQLRSLVIDFEDGLDEEELENAYEKVSRLLLTCNDTSPLIFIRPKDESHLKTILKMQHIEQIDGFILPKFSLENADSYLKTLEGEEFYIMPSIEGSELFASEKLHRLKEILLTCKEKVLLVRFGLEDMLRQLALRRGCDDSIFDLAVGNVVVGTFIALFKSAGFGVSGGVYPCFKDADGFERDAKRDLKEGLFSKTIIHPSQIETLHLLYKVTQEEFDEAREILNSKSVVFAQNGKMAEKKTMSLYSEMILKRAEVYGIK